MTGMCAIRRCNGATSRIAHDAYSAAIVDFVQSAAKHRGDIDKQPVDVNQAVIAVIAEMDHVAHEKHIDIELLGRGWFD